MSEPVRIALVAEGPTDGIVLKAVLRAALGERPFVLTQLQPEGSVAFGDRGGGWVGVYRWCKQAAVRGGGRVGNDQLLFENHDALILHVDADIAAGTYADGAIVPEAADSPLPCETACPPARNTTDAVRGVLLSWCGEVVVPPRTVLYVPSKSTEAWVVAALYPGDAAVNGALPFECYAAPAGRLAQQPSKTRIAKTTRDYAQRSDAIQNAWARIAGPGALGEAERFHSELVGVLPAPPDHA